MSIHPIRTSSAVAEAYYGYLETTFELADGRLRQKFHDKLREGGRLVNGPIVQSTAPFRKGSNILQLLEEGVLSPLFARYPSHVLERSLYRHQERAIRKMVREKRNVVVATGTGSGKTECFMIPICNHLMREYENGTLGPGVRALLLYPMNALANDQVKRLRELFEPFEFITFGRYTGETLATREEALETYRNTFQRDPLPNEMISRQEMWANPPNVLVTNYAMLEYLLLRPDDNAFFDGPNADHWRFLVLDEAHTYSGVKGIETAMLIRRVKDRVAAGMPGRLQCVATSATLGRGVDDAPEIMQFASRLFGEEFSESDLVMAERDTLGLEGVWGCPDRRLYDVWRSILRNHDSARAVEEIAKIGPVHGVPAEVVAEAFRECRSEVDAFLFQVLRGDEHVIRAQECLADNPSSLSDLAVSLFGADVPKTEAEASVAALVSLAVRARSSGEGRPLLPARYHLMLRALSGAWVSFVPEPTVHLDRVTSVPYGDGHAVAYEAGVCQKCGTAYILGMRDVDESGTSWQLLPASRKDAGARYYAVLDGGSASAEVVRDEDEDPLPPSLEDSTRHELCPVCGNIRRLDSIGPGCTCGVGKIVLAETKSTGGLVGFCVVCGGQNTANGIVRSMSSSAEAAASVITTALYQELHVDESSVKVWSGSDRSPLQGDDPDDDWGMDAAQTDPTPGGPKKILVFSDSRQDAAYFAPYMRDSYSRILRRNIVLDAARQAADSAPGMPIMLPDLWRRVELTLRSAGSMDDMTEYEMHLQAQTWVLHEFTGMDRHGLENLGLLGFMLQKPLGWRAPGAITRELGLTESEVWDLYQALFDTLRHGRAVSIPEGLNPQDDVFGPGGMVNSVSSVSVPPTVKPWMPSARGFGNKRSDYIIKVARKAGTSEDTALDLLSKIWSKQLRSTNPGGPWNSYFSPVRHPHNLVSYQLVPSKWSVSAYGSSSVPEWYVCDKCGRLTLRNVRGVCPQYRCSGMLSPADIAERLESNHYVRLYASSDLPRRMRAEEHTAQLRPGAAAQSQTDFQSGRINVLSCSTTFELGVDLGDLEVVLMKNMPPSPANYVQRAGRAGRRTDTAAMVVTYVLDRPHDSFHYRHPEMMINGHISPPHFDLNNEQIMLRHVYAVALADFWRSHRDCIQAVGDFFSEREDGRSGIDLFRDYLHAKPVRTKTSLARIVPEKMKETLQIESWGWVEKLLGRDELADSGPGSESGHLTAAYEEFREDMEALKTRYDELAEKRLRVDHLSNLMNTIRRRYLINFLSSRNVLPRYGFPVDVVTLDTRLSDYADDSIELQRELRLAVSDYAPDSQVVAHGKVWTSRYLQRMPQRGWPRYHYGLCPICGNHATKLDVGDGVKETICDACGASVQCSGVFIEPEFGFLVDPGRPKDAGGQRPERTYSSRVFFSGLASEEDERNFQMAGGAVKVGTSKKGRLAVINQAGGAKFLVCESCGYGLIANGMKGRISHHTAYGRECKGRFNLAALGHEFLSDIARIRFEPAVSRGEEFWYSMLYGIIEGACTALDIERPEIDGCIQWGGPEGHDTSLILFDSVPGGVGHVQRLRSADALGRTLSTALEKMVSCDCGGETASGSCYSCLRNYSNQFCHDKLDRGLVIRFLTELKFGK